MNIKKSSQSLGFTLIELLIVIVIIGILAGIIITVINPAQIQLKARQTVLRTNVEKGCYALQACGVTTDNAMLCDTKAEIGVNNINGTPTGANYYLTTNSAGASDLAATASGDTVYYRGVLGGCSFYCYFDFPSTPSSSLTTTGCLIGIE